MRVNGRELYLAPSVLETELPIQTNRLHSFFEVIRQFLMKIAPPPGAILAAAPVGGLTGKLWPLVDKLQEFGLAVGIAMALWGLCRVIMGDPSGKQQIWQAIIGFVGLFIIPEVFFSIWGAFK